MMPERGLFDVSGLLLSDFDSLENDQRRSLHP
jgi:hypothetical protein